MGNVAGLPPSREQSGQARLEEHDIFWREMRREMVSLEVSKGKKMELWIIYADVYSVGSLTCLGSKPFKVHLWSRYACVRMNEDAGGR